MHDLHGENIIDREMSKYKIETSTRTSAALIPTFLPLNVVVHSSCLDTYDFLSGYVKQKSSEKDLSAAPVVTLVTFAIGRTLFSLPFVEQKQTKFPVLCFRSSLAKEREGKLFLQRLGSLYRSGLGLKSLFLLTESLEGSLSLSLSLSCITSFMLLLHS
jgi:hypothetical protein